MYKQKNLNFRLDGMRFALPTPNMCVSEMKFEVNYHTSYWFKHREEPITLNSDVTSVAFLPVPSMEFYSWLTFGKQIKGLK